MKEQCKAVQGQDNARQSKGRAMQGRARAGQYKAVQGQGDARQSKRRAMKAEHKGRMVSFVFKARLAYHGQVTGKRGGGQINGDTATCFSVYLAAITTAFYFAACTQIRNQLRVPKTQTSHTTTHSGNSIAIIIVTPHLPQKYHCICHRGDCTPIDVTLLLV